LKPSPIILFDGVCNFCNGAVNFIIRQDKKKDFRFAALQSEAGQNLLAKYQLPQTTFESFVLIKNGIVYQKSSAALQVCNGLPWYWQWTQIFWLLPKLLRDAVYDLIARNRYKWFGKKESCIVPTADIRRRFL
jgi:predicted DCC family thiol-disulfide oxidoreductase YuxK